MSQTLSIRFQPPDRITGPTRDLVALLRTAPGTGFVVRPAEAVVPVALPPSQEQASLKARLLRQRLRGLEEERARRTVDGAATWIITDRISIKPSLGERVGEDVVGEGLGKGHIIFGPPDLCLPAGRYTAIIEFEVTDMLDNQVARVTGEVVLNTQRYLSQQTMTIPAAGPHTFRLPFRVREDDLFEHANPAIEVRLDMKSIVAVRVTQVAVVFSAAGARPSAAHPGAYLHSAGNAGLKWLWQRLAKSRS